MKKKGFTRVILMDLQQLLITEKIIIMEMEDTKITFKVLPLVYLNKTTN